MASPGVLRSPVTAYTDSLKVGTTAVTHIRAFAVRDPADVVLYARAGTLVENNPIDMPVAVRTPPGTAGKMVVNSTPVLRLFGFDSGTPDLFASGGRFMVKVLRDFGTIP